MVKGCLLLLLCAVTLAGCVMLLDVVCFSQGIIRGDTRLDECSEMISIVRNLPMPEEFVRAEIRQLSCASPILALS